MDVAGWTPERLASIIDHTFLKPAGLPEDIEHLCEEASRYGFISVAVNPAEVKRCVSLLIGTTVRVGAAVGFPLGQNTTRAKVLEAGEAVQNGAMEIDMVINVRSLKAGDLKIVKKEIASLSWVCQDAKAVSKIILETCYLTDEEKRTACRMAREEGIDFVKTSTGFGPAGATVEDIRLMREVVGPEMGVKAAGGIRTLARALAMVEAGATRLGTSSGVSLVEELTALLLTP